MAKPVAVAGDVFAGFFALGVQEAGFEVPLHLAHVNYGLKTARLNFPSMEIRVGKDRWKEPAGFPPRVDLMFTNPPCASWSGAGMSRKAGACNNLREKWRCDPRSSWPADLAEAALDMRARAFIWESVTNAWKYGRSFVDELAKRFLDQGYAVTIHLQNNCYLGAPQNRQRMFFIAHRHRLCWPTRSYPRTAGEILRRPDLRHDGPRWKTSGFDLLWEKSTTELNYANFNGIYHHKLTPAERAKVTVIPGMSVKVIHPDKLAPVLNERMVHPWEPRFLSLDELAALSGIPRDWKFSGGYHSSALEMARTVLPAAGRYVAQAVRDGLGTVELPQGRYTLVNMLGAETQVEELTA